MYKELFKSILRRQTNKKISKQFEQELHKGIDSPLAPDKMLNIISHQGNAN